MNIRLNPHSERLLNDQLGSGQFQSIEEVIEHAMKALSERAQRSGAMSLAEFEATLDALAEGSERLPVLPLEATSRTGIYSDHD